MSVTVVGSVYNNINANTTEDDGEPGLAGQTVYVDSNNNGALDAGETFTVTDSSGAFSLAGLAANTSLVIRVAAPAGWVDTPSATSASDGAETVNAPDGSTATLSMGEFRMLMTPGDLEVSQASSTTADLSWFGASPDGFEVQYSTDGGAFTTLDTLDANVVSRLLFYNDSSLDGNDTAANANDSNAIATDRSALLPGGDVASDISNGVSPISGYDRGINGVIVDIANLGTRTPTAADFSFSVGNDNNPSGWSAAPAPTAVTVFRGRGVDGSDRVEITWADNAIRNEWLQVTVKADANTGLSADDVFYYGNQVADATGDGTVGDGTNGTDDDYDVISSHYRQTVSGGPSVGDFNVDGVVDNSDFSEWIAFEYHSISKITAPASETDCAYHVSGLSADHDYAFRVLAADANGASNPSNVADPAIGQITSGIQLQENSNDGTIVISWSFTPSGRRPDGFYVFEDHLGAIADVPYVDGVTQYSYTVTGVSPGETHTFNVEPHFPHFGTVTLSQPPGGAVGTMPDNGVLIVTHHPFSFAGGFQLMTLAALMAAVDSITVDESSTLGDPGVLTWHGESPTSDGWKLAWSADEMVFNNVDGAHTVFGYSPSDNQDYSFSSRLNIEAGFMSLWSGAASGVGFSTKDLEFYLSNDFGVTPDGYITAGFAGNYDQWYLFP